MKIGLRSVPTQPCTKCVSVLTIQEGEQQLCGDSVVRRTSKRNTGKILQIFYTFMAQQARVHRIDLCPFLYDLIRFE